jgi:hypothetical protein
MSCDTFEEITLTNYTSMKSKNIIINDYNIKLKNKKFLCWNRMPRPSRLELIANLIRLNLLEHGYCSLGTVGTGDHDHEWIDDLEHLDISTESKNILIKNRSIFPIILNMSEEKNTPVALDLDDLTYYDDSYFSVVTETGYYKNKSNSMELEDSRYFTEKTYKTILAKHPFILVSQAHSLQYLRDRGYKTFHPYINESYDSIEDDDLRLIAIVNEIQRLCQMTDDEWIIWQTNVKEIVEHNHTMLLSKSDYRITRDVEKLFIGESVGF